MLRHWIAIKNAEALIAVYGAWPTFHDAEVISLQLTRGNPSTTLDLDPPSLDIELADRDGPTPTPWLVALRFMGLREVELEGFNEQNVLFEMEVSQVVEDGGQLGWRTVCSASNGLSGEWVSESVEVVSIAPLDARS